MIEVSWNHAGNSISYLMTALCTNRGISGSVPRFKTRYPRRYRRRECQRMASERGTESPSGILPPLHQRLRGRQMAHSCTKAYGRIHRQTKVLQQRGSSAFGPLQSSVSPRYSSLSAHYASPPGGRTPRSCMQHGLWAAADDMRLFSA